MKRLEQPTLPKKFASIHANLHDQFNQEHHVTSRRQYKIRRTHFRRATVPLGLVTTRL